MSRVTRSVIAIFLLALMFQLVACGSSGDKNVPAATTAPASSSAEESTTEPPLSDDIPDIDFKGASFTILNSKSTAGIHYVTTILELDGEQLNDAMYERTKKIEEKYNITFTEDRIESGASAAISLVRNSVAAGDGAVDLAFLLERNAFPITGEGIFIDQGTLPHMNLDKPYWFKSVNEAINFTSKTFLTYGAANLGYYDFMHSILFNKTVLNNLKLENPYDLVRSGKWTFDKFVEMGKKAVADLDGDGSFGDKDSIAFHGASNTAVMTWMAAFKVKTVEVKDRGDVTIALLSNPKVFDVYDKIRSTLWDAGFWSRTVNLNSNVYWQTERYFQEDRALFADHILVMLTYLRDMESDFGILPFPKENEDQKEYGSFIEAGTRVGTIPIDVKNKELSGAVNETLNFLSYRDVIPVYYDITLKSKYSRDEDSAEMLDIITQNVSYDLGATMLADVLVQKIMNPLIKENSTDYVSKVTANMPALEKLIDDAKAS